MIEADTLRLTHSQPVADLYCDNDNIVYMEMSKSRLAVIVLISSGRML